MAATIHRDDADDDRTDDKCAGMAQKENLEKNSIKSIRQGPERWRAKCAVTAPTTQT